MNILEKINEAALHEQLTLHREGLFYKVYNENAMLFVKHIKAYTVVVKYIKKANQEVCSIGFPSAFLPAHTELIIQKLGGKIIEKTAKEVVFEVSGTLKEEQNYKEWKNQQKANHNLKKGGGNKESYSNECSNLKTKLKAFDLLNSTPMEAISFIQELKNIIA